MRFQFDLKIEAKSPISKNLQLKKYPTSLYFKNSIDIRILNQFVNFIRLESHTLDSLKQILG